MQKQTASDTFESFASTYLPACTWLNRGRSCRQGKRPQMVDAEIQAEI